MFNEMEISLNQKKDSRRWMTDSLKSIMMFPFFLVSGVALDLVDHRKEIQRIPSMIVSMINVLNYHPVFCSVHFLTLPIQVRKNTAPNTKSSFSSCFSLRLAFKYPVHSNGYLSVPTTNGNQSSSFSHAFGYSAFAPTLPLHFAPNHPAHHHPYLLADSRSTRFNESNAKGSKVSTPPLHRPLSSSKKICLLRSLSLSVSMINDEDLFTFN